MLIAGVALGGRASLLGPALGAIAVGYGRSTLSEKFPTTWTYFLGFLFILVMLFLPGGISSLWPKLKSVGARLRSAVTRSAVGRNVYPVPATSPAGAEATA